MGRVMFFDFSRSTVLFHFRASLGSKISLADYCKYSPIYSRNNLLIILFSIWILVAISPASVISLMVALLALFSGMLSLLFLMFLSKNISIYSNTVVFFGSTVFGIFSGLLFSFLLDPPLRYWWLFLTLVSGIGFWRLALAGFQESNSP